jgi:hypothetical protein
MCSTQADVCFVPIAEFWETICRKQKDRLAAVPLVSIRWLCEQHPLSLFAAAAQNRQSVLPHDSRISLAHESRIKSRTALRGNDTRGGSQASENVALTRCDGLAVLQCVSLTTVHNMVGQPNASFGKLSLALLEALANVVRDHWHTAALFCKFSTASQPAIPRIGLLGGRLIRVPISV